MSRKKVKKEVKHRNWSLLAMDLILTLQRAVLDDDITVPTSTVSKG